MNSIVTAKYVSITKPFAGRTWFYDFRELMTVFDEVGCASVAQSLSIRYSRLTSQWSKERNSEWICRIYLAAKMILAASVQLSSRQYARSRNLRSVDPYLAYYAVLSLMRAVVFTLPEVEWNQGGIIKLSHKKIHNLALDHITRFNANVAAEISSKVLKLRAQRELISYWHPTSGDRNLEQHDDIEKIATLLAEVAQFNSELIEKSVLKRAESDSLVFLESYIDKLAETQLHGFNFFDQEDSYRLGYLRRKYPAPPNIRHIMTEGHVEDFFGGWVSQDDIPDGFDPDGNWRVIFDVP